MPEPVRFILAVAVCVGFCAVMVWAVLGMDSREDRRRNYRR